MMTTIGDLLGIPFARGGRTREGMDCLGIVLAGLEVLRPDLELDDPWEAIRDDWEAGIRPEVVPPEWEEIAAPVACYRPGDVLFVLADGGPNHVALYIGDNLVLHSMAGAGSGITRLGRIRPKVVKVLRPPAKEASC